MFVNPTPPPPPALATTAKDVPTAKSKRSVKITSPTASKLLQIHPTISFLHLLSSFSNITGRITQVEKSNEKIGLIKR